MNVIRTAAREDASGRAAMPRTNCGTHRKRGKKTLECEADHVLTTEETQPITLPVLSGEQHAKTVKEVISSVSNPSK